MSDASTRTEARPSTGRRIAFGILAFLFGAGALGGLFGIGLVIGWFDNDSAGIHRVHDIGFGILYGILVAAPFFAMVRPRWVRPSLLWQIVGAAAGIVLGAVIATDPTYLIGAGALVVAVAILVAVHPDRTRLLQGRANFSVPMTVTAAAGAVPLVWFALTAARLQRTGSPLDPHVKMEHWTTMSAMAFALVLVAFLAAARLSGYRFTAWCAGIGVSVYGIASMVFHRFPGSAIPYAGSEGMGWGFVALFGGLAFIALAEWGAARCGRRL
jgi:hypothetical protein